jgi:hypothetical protein
MNPSICLKDNLLKTPPKTIKRSNLWQQILERKSLIMSVANSYYTLRSFGVHFTVVCGDDLCDKIKATCLSQFFC